jgi:DNA invertase Pin-like site-specific DNA recombinase
MTGVFAEFERAMIQERVRAGLERAKAQGKVLGRPKASKTVERKILKARKQGKGILRIAKEVGCGTGTVQRVAKLLD